MLEEGWYLMTTEALERELAHWRSGGLEPGGDDVERLTSEEAIAFRSAGNVPDERGRSLRLVLRVASEEDLRSLDSKRRHYEPDFHDPPVWRRPGSRPVNVVPLRDATVRGHPQPWWDDERTGPLEKEWAATGQVAGLRVPADVRGFVLKTVLSLQDSGREATIDAVVGSLQRWLPQDDVAFIRDRLIEANES